VKVLVTGGAGYIGSHTARELRDGGHDVTVLDDLSKGHRAAVPEGVRLVVGDLGDPAILRQALEGCEAVMHFAALLSVAESVANPRPYYKINLVKGLAMLEAMEAAGVRRLIFSSTCATYGLPVRLPMDETHPQDPINPYGSTKRAFERALIDHGVIGVVRSVALRYFNAAGCHRGGSLGEDHRPEEHVIPLAIDAALGRRPGLTIYGDDYDTPDGTCIRDYIHVEDLARAHVLALAAVDKGEPFTAVNLGTEHGYSVKEVIAAVEKVSGRKVPATAGPRRPGDPPRLVASVAKARDVLGFEPEHDLDTIVDSALRWRVDHPEGYGPRA